MQVAVAHRDASAFLTAMLQGENSKKSAPGDINARRKNAENATFFLWTVFITEKIELSQFRIAAEGVGTKMRLGRWRFCGS
jgi:hypothetical protein